MTEVPVAEFLNNVAHLPDIEAEGEIIQRRETHKLEYASLLNEKVLIFQRTGARTKEIRELNLAMSLIASDLSLLNEALIKLRQRMDRLSWQSAVRALYGDEGVLQCKLWIIQNDDNPNREHDINKLLRKRGLQPLGEQNENL